MTFITKYLHQCDVIHAEQTGEVNHVILKLNRFSANPLLGHHALVLMVGFRMAGFMLSGSGIRVFVLGNVELRWWMGKSKSQ